ncbi:MAG: hypothetical protein ACI4N3_02700 [Alphaproteobacteria bacterium]
MQVFCSLDNSVIKNINRNLFFKVEEYLISSGVASDKEDFAEIKRRLINPPILNPEEFAEEVFYVILASGFKQKIAKQKFFEIVSFIKSGGEVVPSNLLPIFGNKNKINAICKVWANREKYRDEFYKCPDVQAKMLYLARLPHIGSITKNHLARNLGINDVKYDVWIQRLGIALYGDDDMEVSFPLTTRVKKVCDKVFSFIEAETDLPRGYIDVVLWKACQIGVFEFK